jgi:hypothetical protein
MVTPFASAPTNVQFSWEAQMDSIFSYIDHAASILTLISFPALLLGVGLFEAFSWGRTKLGPWRRTFVVALLALAAVSYVVDVSDRMGWIKPKEPPLQEVKTTLRLQFFGDLRVPVEIEPSENIFSWYALYGPSIQISMRNAQGESISPPSGMPGFEPTWSIFVVFKEPTKYRQIATTFSNPQLLPPTQVMGNTSRSLIFHSARLMPAGVLEISTTP